MRSVRLRLISQLVDYLDWIITITLAVVVSIAGLNDALSPQVLTSATLFILGAFAFAAIRDRAAAGSLKREIERLPDTIKAAVVDDVLSNGARTAGLVGVYSQTVHHDWLPDIRGALRVTIAKLKLNFTEDPDYFIAFEDVLRRGGYVTIVMSDPRSPAMWLRYKDEPHSVAAQSETAWALGLEEIAAEVERLQAWQERLVSRGIKTDKLRIALFPHYPTHAFYRFDDKLYVFHYPYMARGFHAPAFLFANPGAAPHRFLLNCLDNVIDAAIPLTAKIADDVSGRSKHGLMSDAVVTASEIRAVRRRK
jgi:hypothetical protein